ncbi:hypothetical protein KIN20_009215 [Parelaphostrongylus tenuis]|uniref:Uncharacterized protein n=1 Tax=Parelaphostrongylus tenuis TaxID=148309 RepID=A0AAD5MAU8_PARTN|nr:hypothetical protein KIN20_009215 [Parelaphostrongylus tenuis]
MIAAKVIVTLDREHEMDRKAADVRLAIQPAINNAFGLIELNANEHTAISAKIVLHVGFKGLKSEANVNKRTNVIDFIHSICQTASRIMAI